MTPKNTICLWYDHEAEEAARFYAETFPDSEVGAIHQPKWVVSRTLTSAGPNASLVRGDLEDAVRKLKADHEGEIEVAGPTLAARLTELGLIDEYRIYLHPVVLGSGKPYFAKARRPLRLIAHDLMDEDVIRLRYRLA